MKDGITVDDSVFQGKLAQYKMLTGKSWQRVVNDQARLAAQRLMQLTFPKDKAQGNRRVAIDVGRVYLTNDWFESKFSFRNEKLGDRIKKAVRAADSTQLESIFANSPKFNRLHVEPFDASKHSAARRNGRVNYPAPWSFPVGQQSQLKKFKEAKQKNVGLAKSGWGACVAALGGRVAKWASRDGAGAVTDQSALQENPYVILTNKVGFFAALDTKANIVSRALAGRAEDMMKEARKALEEAAKGAGFAG